MSKAPISCAIFESNTLRFEGRFTRIPSVPVHTAPRPVVDGYAKEWQYHLHINRGPVGTSPSRAQLLKCAD